MALVTPCGLRGCKNGPAPFPGRMSYKATKAGLVSVLYLSMHYTVLLFVRAPFYVSLVYVAMCSVFWLFWLSCQYLPNDWLESLLWGSLIVARGSSPESPGRRVRVIFLVYCITSLFYYAFMLSPAPTWYNYFPNFMTQYSLFVLKVPLNPKQTNKQAIMALVFSRCLAALNYTLTYESLYFTSFFTTMWQWDAINLTSMQLPYRV